LLDIELEQELMNEINESMRKDKMRKGGAQVTAGGRRIKEVESLGNRFQPKSNMKV